MEYLVIIFVLIFLFAILIQINSLTDSINRIREEIASFRDEFLKITPKTSPVNQSVIPDAEPVTASDVSYVDDQAIFTGLSIPGSISRCRDYILSKEKSVTPHSCLKDEEKYTPSIEIADNNILETLPVSETVSQPVIEKPTFIEATLRQVAEEPAVNTVPDVWKKIENFFSTFNSPVSFWKRIEQEFAARWMVWIGGITMALGVIFMLKVGNEHGLFGPVLRISVATALSCLMVAGGEFIRRSRFQLPLMNARYIPGALSGAGIIGLYASMLAAKYLYDMFPMPVLMLLLSMISLLAMILALMQGAFMAALGLLGAYTVPLFVSTGSNNVSGLLEYVFLVTLASIGLMRKVYRHWLWLGAMAGNYLWLLISLIIAPHAHQPARLLFLFVTTYAFLAWPHLGWELKSKIRFRNMQWKSWPQSLRDPLLTGLVAAVLLAILTFSEKYSLLTWVTLILGVISLLVIARRSAVLDLFVPLAGILAISPFIRSPEILYAHSIMMSLTALAILGLCCGGYGLYLVIRPIRHKLWWALLSTVVPLLIVVGTYLACRGHYRPNIVDYTLLAVCTTLFLAWNAFSDIYRRGTNKLRVIYQIAAQIALLFALFVCFSEVTLTLLLAGQLLLLVVWQRLRDVILPSWIIKALAIILLIRLSMNMYILYYVSPLHIGSWGIPWTLYGFSIPIICLWLGARWLPVRNGDQTRAWLAGNAIYLLALWINVELRHLLHGSYHLSFDFSSLTDCALHAVTFGIMALAYGYRERAAESLRFVYRLAAQISAGLMLLLTSLCLSLFNPIWSAQSVGSFPLFNMVTVAYLIPMLFMLLALRFWPNEWLDTHLKPYVAGAVALLGMVFITLTVRQLWHGNFLDAHQIYNGEQYSYSLMWMVTAIAMMYHAIRWPNRIIRRASLGLLALTIVKLFLWDMAGLHGLYRSLSFLGLGLCLVAIGWFYQKYVVLADAAEQNTAEIGSENGS